MCFFGTDRTSLSIAAVLFAVTQVFAFDSTPIIDHNVIDAVSERSTTEEGKR
jgi:hypothetical protein